VALSSCRSVGYYTDRGSNQIQPDSVITQAGLTPVLITNAAFPTFVFNSVDFLFINEQNNGGISSALSNRLSEIEAWVRAGGHVIFHTRAAGSAGTPLLLGFSPTVFRSISSNVNVVPPGATLVTSGPHGTVTNTNLDGGSGSTHGYAVSSSLLAGTTKILSEGTDTTKISTFYYELDAGGIYWSSIPLDFYLGKTTSLAQAMTNIYAPNVLEFMKDVNTQAWSCGGLDRDNPLACSGNGSCTAQDLCVCDTGYNTPNCSTWNCSSIPNDVSGSCFDNGSCIAPDVCVCDFGFFGQFCDNDLNTFCFGIDSDDPFVCNGQGSCQGTDLCVCDPFYEGSQCEIWKCGSYRFNDSLVCSGHGTCISANNCVCSTTGGVFSDSFVDLSNWNVVGVIAADVCGFWDSPTAAVFQASSGSRNMRMKDYYPVPPDGNVNVVFHATAGFGGNCETPDPNEHINVYLDREFASDLLLGTIPYNSRSWRRYDMFWSGISGRFRLYFSQNQHSGMFICFFAVLSLIFYFLLM